MKCVVYYLPLDCNSLRVAMIQDNAFQGDFYESTNQRKAYLR